MSVFRSVPLAVAVFAPAVASAQVVNPDFADGLVGWTVAVDGGTTGVVLPVAGGARLLEGDALLVRLEQTFVVPLRPLLLSFWLTEDPGFDPAANAIPDAFEVRVTDAGGLPLLTPWSYDVNTWFNLQESGVSHVGPGASFDGRWVTVDARALPAGALVTLSFSLVGGDGDHAGGVTIGGVELAQGEGTPVVSAGDDLVAECAEPFTLDGRAFDVDGDPLLLAWSEEGVVLGDTAQITLARGVGLATFVLSATDALGVSATDEVEVDVRDTHPPEITAAAPVDALVGRDCKAPVPEVVATVVDTCSAVTVTQDPPAGARVAAGTVTLTLTAVDASGNRATATVPFTALDPGASCLVVDTGAVDTDPVVVDTDTGDTADTDPVDTVVDTPVDTDPVDTPPVDTPVDTDPVDTVVDTPVDTDPVDTPPVDTPVDTDPVDTPPVDTPVDTDPVDTPPVDTPVDTLVDTDPVDTPPADTDVDTPADTDVDTPLDTDIDTLVDTDTVDTDTVMVDTPPMDTPPVDTPIDTDLPIETDHETGPRPETGHTDEVDTPVDTPDIVDSDPAPGGDKDPVEEPDGCGCDTPARPTSLWMLAAGWLLARRRRAVGVSLLALPLVARAHGEASPPVPIALDTAYSGNIDDPEHRDLYSFTAAPGDVIYVERTATSNSFGLNWRLSDAFGRILAPHSADLGDLGRVTLLGGDYTLEVFAEAGQTGTYSFVVWSVHDATFMAAVNGHVTGTIDHPGEIDAYAMPVDPGTSLLADVVTTSNAYGLAWSLTDPWGLLVDGRADALLDAGPWALLGGDYRLLVQSDNDGGTGTYDVWWVGEQPDLAEAFVSTPFSGAITNPGDEDRWTLTLPADGAWTFDVTASSNVYNLGLAVTDAAGGLVWSQADLTDKLDVPLAAGVYTLRVTGEGAATGTYTMRVDPVVDLTDTLTPAVITSAAFSVPGQTASWSLSLPVAQRLWMDNEAGFSVYDYTWWLNDAYGRRMAGPYTDLGFVGPFALPAGDYTVVVDPEASATGTPRFSMHEVAWSTGTLIDGVSTAGSLSGPGGRADYALSAPAGLWDLEVSTTSNRFGLDVQITDAAGRSVLARTTELSTLRGLALTGGAYTVSVFGEGENTGSWTLRMVRTGDAPFVASGAAAAAGVAQSGSVTAGAPVRHAVTINTPTRAYFDLTAGNASLDWALFDPAGRAVWGPSDARYTDLNDAEAWLLPGTYTLELTAASGTVAYAFAWYDVTAEATSVAALNTPFSGAFTRPGERQTWSFHTDAAQDVFFDVGASASRLYWTLSDANGVPVFSDLDASHVDLGDEGPLRLGPGDWFLTLDPRYDTAPAYTITITTPDNPVVALTPGESVTASVARAGGVWTGTVVAAGGEQLALDVTTANGQVRWSLLDPQGLPRLDTANPANATTGDEGPFLLSAGTWSVVVDPQYGATSPLTFTPRFVSHETVALPLDAEVTGALAGSGDYVTLTLHLDQSTRVFFDWTAVGTALQATLRDGLGRVVTTDGSLTQVHNDDMGPFDLAAGDYTMEVKADGAAVVGWGLVARTVTDTSEVVPLNGTYVRAISGPGATHTLHFDVEHDGDQIFVDLVDGDTYATWELRDAVGEPVFASASANDASTSDEGPFSLRAGAYQLILDADNDYATPITFRLGRSTGAEAQFYYSRYSGNVRVKRGSYDFNGGTFNLTGIFDVGSPPGGDGLLVAPDGDIVLGGQGAIVYKVNPETGAWTSAPTTGYSSYHVSLDPSGTKVWTSNMPGPLYELPLVPFGAPGQGHAITGDVNGVTSLAFDRAGRAWFTSSGSAGNGSFGRIDMTTFVTDRIYSSLPAAHGIAFDPYTGHIILMGATHITQIDPETTEIVADLDVGTGYLLDQGSVDGLGHVFAADNNGKMVFVDYSGSGRVDDPYNFTWAEPLDTFVDDVAPMSWLGSACAGAPAISGLDPADDAVLPTGTRLVLSGHATPMDPTRPVVAVLVDGLPADGLDAWGSFFDAYTVVEGPQELRFEAVDRCGSSTVTLHLVGEGGGASGGGSVSLQPVTASLQTVFSDTSFHTGEDRLRVLAQGVNTGDVPLQGPLMLAPRPDVAGVVLDNPAGVTEDGLRYVQLLGPGELLAPGASTATAVLWLKDPGRTPVALNPVWLSTPNLAPAFGDVPQLRAEVGQAWSWAPEAADPEGSALSWSLDGGPLGMTLDPDDGALAWTPDAAGDYGVRLTATDALGASATMSFVLTVVPAASNHPPAFVSVPVTHASVGEDWRYAAEALDHDGDALSWRLDVAPAGMTVDAAGVVRWPFALPGLVDVRLVAADAFGAEAVQAFTLSVGQVSIDPGVPQITSEPPGSAEVAGLYFYQPVGYDADGDVLVWRLAEGPAEAVTDPSTGRTTWTPAESDLGAAELVLEADDGRGGVASQRWTVTVSTSLADRAPVFTSAPPALAVVGQPFTYDADALDPEAGAVIYAAATGPAGVNASTGELLWTPDAAGTVTLGVSAADAAGNTSSQVFVVRVRASNDDPQIRPPSAEATVTAGQTWQVDLGADDADHDALVWSIVNAPPGVTVDPRNGLVTWTPTPDDAGAQTITVRADDGFGGGDGVTLSVTVELDTTGPDLAIFALRAPICADEPVTLCVNAVDPASIAVTTLAWDGAPVVLDALGCAEVNAGPSRVATALATATDSLGNGGALAQDELVLDCDDPDAPTVTLVSPAPAEVIEGPVPVVIQVNDTSVALTWVVERARHGEGAWTELARGAGPVDGEVAVFDPTLLPAGDWDLRVHADDGVNFNTTTEWVAVTGEGKVGNLRVAFVDASLELRGFPVSISRVYDSLDTRPADFGAGWTLGLAGNVTDTPAESTMADPFLATLTNSAFVPGERVTVMAPDGRMLGFTFGYGGVGVLMPFVHKVEFTPDPGVPETLTAEGSGYVFDYGSGAMEYIYPFNPGSYTLRTPGGIAWTYTESDGLVSAEDSAGNTITVTDDGIVHSDGTTVVFVRDAGGQITEIDEPGGAVHRYGYTPTGDLASYTDPSVRTATYDYDDAHHLLTWTDPGGAPVLRTVYDDEGRVQASCPPSGDITTLVGCTVFDHDVIAGSSVVTDVDGRIVTLYYDAATNIVREERLMDDGSVFEITGTWDDAHRPLERTVEGATWTWAWDDAGDLLSGGDPRGDVWTWTWDACGLPLSEQDPDGNTFAFENDADCHPTRVVDPVGGVWTSTFNEYGELSTITDPDTQTWTMLIDGAGREYGVTSPGDRTLRNERDGAGNVSAVIDGTGARTEYTHDEAHRLLTEHRLTDGVLTTWTWDDAGRLDHVSDPASTVSFGWQTDGRIAWQQVEVTAGPTMRFDYAWSPGGKLQSVTDSTGAVRSFTHDALGRSETATWYVPGVGARRVDTAWDATSRLARLSRFADADGLLPVFDTIVGYDAPGDAERLSVIRHEQPDTTLIAGHTMTRDGVGRVLAYADAEGDHVATRDGLGRLLGVDHPDGGVLTDEVYAWDGASNRTASVDGGVARFGDDLGEGGHLLRQDGRYDWTWDGAGRLVTRVDRGTGEALQLSWNQRDLVTDAVVRDAGGTELHRVHTDYDPVGRPFAITRDGVRTWIGHDGYNPAFELADDGTPTVRRWYVSAMDAAFAEEIGGTVRWLATDGLGSVTDVVDDGGLSIDHRVYDAFGRTLSGGTASTLGWVGRPVDPITGLVDLRARVYDPWSGRFLSPDPLVPFGFVYAHGDPLTLRDPTGEGEAIEYACLAVQAVGLAYGIWGTFGVPAQMLLEETNAAVEAALAGLPPPPTNPGSAMEAMGDGMMGMVIPTTPSDALGTATMVAGAVCTYRSLGGKGPGGPPKKGIGRPLNTNTWPDGWPGRHPVGRYR